MRVDHAGAGPRTVALPVPLAPVRLRALTGARAVIAGLALGAGFLYGAAQPPFEAVPLAWVCLVPLLLALGACRGARGAALCGFGFAIVFSAVSAGWLVGATRSFFGVSSVAAWGVALAVYAVFAGIPFAVFGMLARVLLRASGRMAVLVGLPALYVATELLRTYVVCGLPWALLGHAFYRMPVLIQVADLAGVYGISWVVATVNAALMYALRRPRHLVLPLAVGVTVVGGSVLYGYGRLATVAEAVDGPAVRVGVLQPNEAPVYHGTQVSGDRALVALSRQSRQQFAGTGVDLVVWPENAIPFYVDRNPEVQARLRSLADALGAALVVGAPAAAPDDSSRSFNGAHLVPPGRGALSVYRKRRLVPFAEYQPLRGDADGRSFAAGGAPVLFSHAGVEWGPTICLDIIYPAVARDAVRAGAEVLVNLSNDSWLGAGGAGAATQQFAQAVFRAVEYRRDVVRATSTGISAVIGADGIARAMLLEHRAGGLIAAVAPRRGLTPYARVGDAFALACVLLAACTVLRAGRTTARPR